MSKRTTWQRVAWWALALALTAGCFRFVPPDALTPQSGSLVQFVTPLPAAASPLLQAMAFLPVDPEGESLILSFTDWALIKAYEGAEHINSRTERNEKFDFLIGLADTQAPFAAFGLTKIIAGQTEVWGWDTTDLLWEANTYNGPPLYVLKFPTGYDFAPIIQRFAERGFTRADYRGVPVYSHPMDISQAWLHATEFGILNTAVLADEGILILSTARENVHAALDTYYGDDVLSYADMETVRATAQQLGKTAAAFLSLDACAGLAVDALLQPMVARSEGQSVDELRAAFQQAAAGLHAYDVLGVGYRYEGDVPVGLVLMHYSDAEPAQADLAARLAIAQQGESLRTLQPYSETVIAMKDATVEGTTLILRGRPAGDRPQRLVQMVAARDMFFAVCP